MKKAVCVILIIAAVALGAMHGHYSFLHANGRLADDVGFLAYLSGDYKLMDRVASRSPKAGPGRRAGDRGREGAPAAPRAPRKVTPEPVVEETKPPREVVDIAAVPGMIRSARELYGKSEYKSAMKSFENALAILTRAARQASPHFKEASNYAKRCRVFEALVGNIPYLELSDGRGLSRIELESGRTIIARVLKDDGDNVTIQQNDGIEATLSYDQIDAMNPVTPQEFRSQLLIEFKKRESKADPRAYFDVFGVALFAMQNRLRDQITPILEKTFMLPGSELVLQTFYTGEDADQLIVALLESFDKHGEAKSYGEKIAALAEPLPPPEPIGPGPEPTEPGPEPPPEPVRRTPVGPPGSKSAKLEEAGQYFAAGQRLANYATRNVSKRDFYGKKAQVELGKARDILNTLQDQNPGDMEIEHLLQQVSDLLHFVIHNLVGI